MNASQMERLESLLKLSVATANCIKVIWRIAVVDINAIIYMGKEKNKNTSTGLLASKEAACRK